MIWAVIIGAALTSMAQSDRRGAEIWLAITAKYPFLKSQIDWGNHAAIFIPESEWARLPASDQKSLVLFMPQIAKLTGRSSNDWVIVLGQPTTAHGEKTLTVDRFVVCGDAVSAEDCGSGRKASAFLGK